MRAYDASARGYLARAQQCLAKGTPKALFYAAFELRCGIEARMQDYLAVQEHVSERKKAGWRIPKLGKDIEAAFSKSDKVARFAITLADRPEIATVLYYTPVTRSLQEKGARLGKLLHSGSTRDLEDEWWETTRAFLNEVVRELQQATRGTLLGVPLFNPETGELSLKIEMVGDLGGWSPELLKDGPAGITLEVAYLDQFPTEH